MRSTSARAARFLSSVASIALLAAAVAGCASNGGGETTGSVMAAMATGPEGDWRRQADALAGRYRTNPQDPDVALDYAHALRMTGQRAQAVAVLEQATIVHPNHRALLGAYGKALADNGNYQQALGVLGRAHTPEQPDWRILSAQGAVLDQMGRHGEAQRYYSSALKIVPDEPSVLSNLGLSYALSKDLRQAETTLKRAATGRTADPRVRQNLALVVGLQGRFEEAESIARADLPPDEAAANVEYLRQMLARQGARKNAEPAAPRARNARS